MHPMYDHKSKSKVELGQTYFGYDGTLGKTSHFTSKTKTMSNSIGYKISERSTVFQSSSDLNKLLTSKKEHFTSAKLLMPLDEVK